MVRPTFLTLIVTLEVALNEHPETGAVIAITLTSCASAILPIKTRKKSVKIFLIK